MVAGSAFIGLELFDGVALDGDVDLAKRFFVDFVVGRKIVGELIEIGGVWVAAQLRERVFGLRWDLVGYRVEDNNHGRDEDVQYGGAERA